MPRVNVGKTRAQLAAEKLDRQTEYALGEIRAELARQNLSRKQLAELTGYTYKQTTDFMAGRTAMTLGILIATADALKLDDARRAALLGGTRIKF